MGGVVRYVLLVWAAFLALALQAVPASAGLSYTLNCTVNPCSGGAAGNNYGTVNLAAGAAGHVTVTVTLAANEKFADQSSGYGILWSINGDPNLTVTLQGSNASDFTVQNSGNASHYLANPFGNNPNNCNGNNANSCFDYAVAHKNGSGTDTTLAFDVTSSTGLVLSDFVANNQGFSFAAMILQTGNSTPFYVASNGTPVAEPQTWTMSLAGLLILGLVKLQRRRRSVPRPTVLRNTAPHRSTRRWVWRGTLIYSVYSPRA